MQQAGERWHEQQAKRERKALFDALKPGTPESSSNVSCSRMGSTRPKKSDESVAAGGTHMTAQASLVVGTTAGRPLEGEKRAWQCARRRRPVG